MKAGFTMKKKMTISLLLFKLTFKHIFIGTVLFSYIFPELRGTKKENSGLGDMNVKMFHLSKKKKQKKQNT